jgi:hypothetical protein
MRKIYEAEAAKEAPTGALADDAEFGRLIKTMMPSTWADAERFMTGALPFCVYDRFEASPESAQADADGLDALSSRGALFCGAGFSTVEAFCKPFTPPPADGGLQVARGVNGCPKCFQVYDPDAPDDAVISIP